MSLRPRPPSRGKQSHILLFELTSCSWDCFVPRVKPGAKGAPRNDKRVVGYLRPVLVFAGVLLIMIFVGGIGMILNAGNPEAAKSSNKTLTAAVMGFAILIAAFWIVKIIEIIFGINIFQQFEV